MGRRRDLPGPTPTFCPVFPADCLRQAHLAVRGKTAAPQSGPRYQRALRLHHEPAWPQEEAGHRVGLWGSQVRRWRPRWTAGDFAVAATAGRGRQSTFSPAGPRAGQGRGVRSGGGNPAPPESAVPGRGHRPRPPSPGQTAQAEHGVVEARDRGPQAVAVPVRDLAACSRLGPAGRAHSGPRGGPLARPTAGPHGPPPQG